MTGRYRHLRLDERELLSRMKNGKVPVSQMAARLGRQAQQLSPCTPPRQCLRE